jgi:hypothetical protein
MIHQFHQTSRGGKMKDEHRPPDATGLTIREQAELALRLPADRRLELLLHSPKPMRLVRALPDADLYLTVREVGPADAMPLISLASAAQIMHLIDLESWRNDRFDAKRCGAWVALLLEAGDPPLRRFLRNVDDELLAMLFQSWIRIEQIEYEDSAEVHGHGESETGSERGFVTPDGYYRFSPSIPEHASAIGKLLQFFYQSQPQRYQEIIWTAQWELPLELEEKALRWRQSRLEEHGFPPWDEAISIYAPPTGESSKADPPPPSDPDGLAAPRSLMAALPTPGPLAAAVTLLDGDIREAVLHQTISLANHLLIADSDDTGDPDSHRRALTKAGGYIGIALAGRGIEQPADAARILTEVPVMELFREGYAEAARLQRGARELLSSGWASDHPRSLELLDAPIRKRMRGLLASRPLYVEFDERGQAGEGRDFASMAEIEETRVSLEMAEVVGRLLIRGLGLDIDRLVKAGDPAAGRPYRFSNVMLTLLAWHAARSELRSDPLPPDIAAGFIRDISSADEAFGAMIKELADRFAIESREISVLQAFCRFCLKLLAEECGSLDPGAPIDYRYISCLLLES